MTAARIAVLGLAALVGFGVGCSSDDKGKTTPDSTTEAESNSTEAGPTGTQAAGGDSAAAPAVALPADWPAELALPDGVTPTEVTDLLGSTAAPGTQTTFVVASIDGDVKAVYDTLHQQLIDAGVEIVGTNFTATETGGFGGISGRGATYTVAISFGPDPTGDINQVTISLAGVEG